MSRFSNQRRLSISRRMRELGKRSQQIQQARRLAALAEESGEATTGSIGAGDAIGLLAWLLAKVRPILLGKRSIHS